MNEQGDETMSETLANFFVAQGEETYDSINLKIKMNEHNHEAMSETQINFDVEKAEEPDVSINLVTTAGPSLYHGWELPCFRWGTRSTRYTDEKIKMNEHNHEAMPETRINFDVEKAEEPDVSILVTTASPSFYDPWSKLCFRWGTRSTGYADKASRRTDELPFSSKDLVFLKPSKTFLAYACERVFDISPQQRGALLALCLGYLAIPLRSSTQFDFQFAKTTNTTRSLLSFEDALSALVPDMLQLTFYWFCWIVTLPLFLESALIAQILVVLLLIFSPIFYVLELIQKNFASKIDVACGNKFKLSRFWFTVLGAVMFSLVIGLVVLLITYLIWRRFLKAKPRVVVDFKGMSCNIQDQTDCLMGD